MTEKKEELIDQFSKTSVEIVEVQLLTWKEKEYVDIRIFYQPNPVDESSKRPTKKGVRIDSDLLPRLIRALQKVQLRVEGKTEAKVKERSKSEETKNRSGGKT